MSTKPDELLSICKQWSLLYTLREEDIVVSAVELQAGALAYIRSRLSLGHTLASLLFRLPLEAGEMFTYAPQPLSPARLTQFETGGLVSQRAAMNKVETFILAYLAKGGQRYVILEDAISLPGDTGLTKFRTRRFTYRQEVYHYLTPSDSIREAVSSALSVVVNDYLTIGVLTSGSQLPDLQMNHEVKLEQLHALAMGTEYVLVGAYDNESMVVWKRNPTKP